MHGHTVLIRPHPQDTVVGAAELLLSSKIKVSGRLSDSSSSFFENNFYPRDAAFAPFVSRGGGQRVVIMRGREPVRTREKPSRNGVGFTGLHSQILTTPAQAVWPARRAHS